MRSHLLYPPTHPRRMDHGYICQWKQFYSTGQTRRDRVQVRCPSGVKSLYNAPRSSTVSLLYDFQVTVDVQRAFQGRTQVHVWFKATWLDPYFLSNGGF